MAATKKTTVKTTTKTNTAKTSAATASAPKAGIEDLKKTVTTLKNEVAELKKALSKIGPASGSADLHLRNAVLAWAERLPTPVLRKFLNRAGITKS